MAGSKKKTEPVAKLDRLSAMALAKGPKKETKKKTK